MRDSYPKLQFTDVHSPLMVDDEHLCIPSRMRGEHFDQKPRATYSFLIGSRLVAGNLLAIHAERTIVVQFDVAKSHSSDWDWKEVSPRAVRFANRELARIRRGLVGFRARTWRFMRRESGTYLIDGPFLPDQPGVALMMMTIRVSREANFDVAYQRLRRFLELHKANEDRDFFTRRWLPQEPTPPVRNEPDPGYPWTLAEFEAIERMARLETPQGNCHDDAKQSMYRREYNRKILDQVQVEETSEKAVVVETDASIAANNALKDYFESPLRLR